MSAPAHAVVSLDPLSTRLGIMRFVGFAALLICGWVLAEASLVRPILYTPLVLASVYAIWAIAAFNASPDLILGVKRAPMGARLSASFLSPNTAGTLFASLSALIPAYLYVRTRKIDTWRELFSRLGWEYAIAILILSLLLIALVLTGSKGAMLALFMTMLMLSAGAVAGQLAAMNRLLPRILIGTAVFCVLWISAQATNQWSQWAGSWSERTMTFTAFGELIEKKLWFGYGIGTFEWQVNLASNPENAIALSWIGAVHNFYIQTIAEQGLLGGGALLFAILLIMMQISEGLIRKNDQATILAPLFAALLTILIHGLSDYALEIPSMTAMTAFVMGLAGGTAAVSQNRRKRQA